MSIQKVNPVLDIMAHRRNEMQDILFDSKAVSVSKAVERIESSILPGRIESYLVPVPEHYVAIDYGVFANDLVKNGYGNVREFSKEVCDMLMLFCDDDDQISIKICELEANMQLILQEFVPTFPEGTPVCKELRGKEETE